MSAISTLYRPYRPNIRPVWVLFGPISVLSERMKFGTGGMISHFGDFTLMGMAFRIGYNVATDPKMQKAALGALAGAVGKAEL